MTKITVDRALIEQALMLANAVDRPNSRGSWRPTGGQLNALRNALRTALAEPAVELSVGDSTVLAACQKLAQALPPPPAEPAPVPLLSDEEIIDAGLSIGWVIRYMDKSESEFARAIEQLVRRKAGL